MLLCQIKDHCHLFYQKLLRLQCGPGSLVGIATGYGLDGQGIESRWGRDFLHLSRPAHPAFCTMGTGSFPGVKSGRGVTLTSHPLLVPRSWKTRAIPLLPLWAVRPVQSLSACTRVTFTFTFDYYINGTFYEYTSDWDLSTFQLVTVCY
jgi:hypothetical protein